jgi:hypothetical protein
MNEKVEEETSHQGAGGFGVFLVGLAIAFGLLYLGGWEIIWQQTMRSASAFVLEDDSFAVRFNDLYYGASITERFFDSPVISWLCLMFAFGLSPVGVFFFGGDD